MYDTVGCIFRKVDVTAFALIGKTIVVNLGGSCGQMDKAMYTKSCQSIRKECGQRLKRTIRMQRQLTEIMFVQLPTDVLDTRITRIIEEADGRQCIELLIEGRQQSGTL